MMMMLMCRPDDEVGVRLAHDAFLGANVFLLSRVDDVTLLQDLHGERLRPLALQLNLNNKQTSSRFLLHRSPPTHSFCHKYSCAAENRPQKISSCLSKQLFET